MSSPRAQSFSGGRLESLRSFPLVGRRLALQSVRGYIRGNPVAILMAYVVGLFCCYVPWSLVMVCCFVFDGLFALLWYGAGDFGLDLDIGVLH